ncbi:MAG: hypothetical protein ACKO8I_19195, partial [Cyanobacteriota bacterium]
MRPAHNPVKATGAEQTPCAAGFRQSVASCAIKASSWGPDSSTLRQPLDFRQLFKLRLVVAALGETQRLGWW